MFQKCNSFFYFYLIFVLLFLTQNKFYRFAFIFTYLSRCGIMRNTKYGGRNNEKNIYFDDFFGYEF